MTAIDMAERQSDYDEAEALRERIASLPDADEQLLRQLLFNLLLNAIQAVPANGEIEIHCGKAGALEAWLEVRDNGPGVPENRAEIFKPISPPRRRAGWAGRRQQIVWPTAETSSRQGRGGHLRLTH
jgi:C4-dicarboxylate-specific signal transduction histidine kinase